MCKVCQMIKDKELTNKEALKAVGELLLTDKADKHLLSIVEKIMQQEVPYKERDVEMEKLAADELGSHIRGV